MYLEYDWTFDVYRVRFGTTFIDFQGWRSFESKSDAKHILEQAGLRLGRKTDTRTWLIVAEKNEHA